jgi:hypothetical protein
MKESIMHRQRLLGAALGASLIAITNLADAQAWPSTDAAARPARGSQSGAPAGEGPGAEGSQGGAQGQVLQGDGAPLPNPNAPGVVVVVPPAAPVTTIVVPAPADSTPQSPVPPDSSRSTQ